MQAKQRDIIERILALEKEQSARAKGDMLARYNKGDKVHLKQLEFHRSPKRNRWVFGGNRSGKTECGAVETVWMARGIHPYRANKPNVSGWVVSVSAEVQKEVAQKKILHYLRPDWIERIVMLDGSKDYPLQGIIDTIYVRNVFGGISSIGFKSCQQGREKFQGASLDFVWFDEEPTRDVYYECLMRVVDKVGDVFGTMTPLKGLTWVYDEIYLNPRDDPEIWCTQMEWGDNPFLKKAEIERLSKVMGDDDLDARKYGRFQSRGGMVYPEFDVSVHLMDPVSLPKEWQCAISIDPGLKNPLSCHFYYMDYDGVIYVVDEHYEAGRDVGYHAEKILAKARALDWGFREDGRLEVLIDSASNQRTLASLKSVSDLFYEHGIVCNTNVNKDLFSGIAKVRELFRERPARIYIFKTCTNMIREIKGYSWGSGDVPIKRDDHAMDELRYFVQSRIHTTKPKSKPTKLEIHKQRLLRAYSRR
ncbi:MAG: terminase family protein [Clostridia bacterium]|nr:terminase family protein [Clostridia bacterium]